MNTLELYEKLVAVRVPDDQARVLTEALAQRDQELVTKDHLDMTLTAELAPIKIDIGLLKADIVTLRNDVGHNTWLLRGIGIILVGQIIATWVFGKH